MGRLRSALVAIAVLASFVASAGEAEWESHMQAGIVAFRVGDYRTADTRFEEAVKEAQLFGELDVRFADSLHWLGSAYASQNRYGDAERLYHRALAIREKVLGPEHSGVARILDNLAMVYSSQGRHAEAEPLLRRSLAIVERALATKPLNVAEVLNMLAGLYQYQGRPAEAEPLHRRALAIREEALGPAHPHVAESLHKLANVYWTQGRDAEAERLYRRALAIQEKALGPHHWDVARHLSSLADVYQSQGRYAEAEPLHRRALAIREKRGTHVDVAGSLNRLAALYERQRRYAEAEPLSRRSLAIREKALGPEHPDVASSLDTLAWLYRSQRRHAEAEPLFQRALAILEKALGPEHPRVGSSLNNLAALYVSQRRYAEAEPLLQRALAIQEKAGPEHPAVATLLNNLAGVYRMQEKFDEGIDMARRATAILSRRFTKHQQDEGRAALAEQRTRSFGFEQHVALLADDAAMRPAMSAPHAAEGFQVAQLARASDTAEQVARMAVRFAAGNDALAQLVRQRQDLTRRGEALDAAAIREVSKPAAQRDVQREERLREEREALQRQTTELDARLEREYPKYRELTDSQPLTLHAAQKLLGEDEALVVYLVSREDSFVWAVRRSAASFQRLAVKPSEVLALVQRLRAVLALDSIDWRRQYQQPFDAAAAHELYRRLFAPVEPMLAGARHVIVTPDGPLQSLPFAVLVTDQPQGRLASLSELIARTERRNLGIAVSAFQSSQSGVSSSSQRPSEPSVNYSEIAWLIKKYPITVFPAVSSLRALRAFARADPANDPFIGFGDPLLDGGTAARNVTLAKVFSRGAVADVKELRQAHRLPETADELRAIAATLKGQPKNLYLGAAATETRLKALDLSVFRHIAFATHGLVAGEISGIAEPALVLTPPEQGTELDDGVLTASEIAQLKLNAEWVILSACNTAASDGTPGAEGLSGLAKAFFYAGARSLLVSHWAVSSDAAVALTTSMFEESAKDASKAQALQRSMLAMMQRQDKPYFGHPAMWAPFIVVGEGK